MNVSQREKVDVGALQPLSRSRHVGWYWRRAPDFKFALGRVLVPITVAELPRAAGAFPLVMQPLAGPASSGLFALLGLTPDRNVFIDRQGRWRGGYIPAQIRGYPFQMAATSDGQFVACVDESAEVLSQDPGAGEPLLDAQGAPTPAVREVLKFLDGMARQVRVTHAVCKALWDQQLLEPWAPFLPSAGSGHRVQGLYRVNENALQKLAPEGLAQLRDHEALKLAYAAILSQSHTRGLQERYHALEKQRAADVGDWFEREQSDWSFDFDQ